MSGTVAAVEPRLRENRLARHVALLGLATVVSGILIGGVAGRIVMRVSALAAGPEMVGRITENGNRIGEFTVGGTLVLIVFVGALGGVLASIVVVGSEPWLKWMGPARGFGFALAVLAVYGYEEPFDSIDFLILEPTSLNVAMFIGLFVVFGLTVTALFWLFDRKLPKAGEDQQPGYLVLDALGALALFVTIFFFTSPDFCGCEPAYEIGALLLVMTASTGIRYASSLVDTLPHWLVRGASFTGYGSLALLLAIGLSRTVDQIQQFF
jgi:hypothetical protein